MSIKQRKGYRKSIDPKDIDDILNLRRQGKSLVYIASIYGMSPYPIQQLCKRNNVFHKYVPDAPYYWTTERKQQVVSLWHEGMSYEEIATYFEGKTSTAIANLVCIMRAEGWDVPRRNKNQYIRKPGVTYLNK